MKRSVNFSLDDLPPHLRSQAERQIAADNARRLKSPLRKPPEKHPIRIPKKRTPNETERRWVSDHGNLADWHYEAMSFSCPSGRYTPDWIGFDKHGVIAVEVKGSYRFGSQSGAAAKFKECANLYPQIHWIWARWTGKRWECEDAGGESARMPEEAPDRPGESPHVRPCAGARDGVKNLDAPKRYPQLPEHFSRMLEHQHFCDSIKECPLGPSLVKCGDRYFMCKAKHLCFNAWLHSTAEQVKSVD